MTAECGLEKLPPELRIQILLQLEDFSSLRSLIFASPSYHATYVERAREEVLCHVALQQIDHQLRPDALAAVRSANFYEVHRHKPQGLFAFLKQYGLSRGPIAHSDSEWLTCRGGTEAIDLIHLYKSITRVAADYCVSIATKMQQGEPVLNLAHVEQLRLYRAIYRFQIYCNFFGSDLRLAAPDGGDRRTRFEDDPAMKFLHSFPPWEVEEMACIWHYLKSRWASILREVSHIYVPKHISKGGPDDDSDLEDTFAYLHPTHDDSSDDTWEPPADANDLNYHQRNVYEVRRDFLAHLGPHFLAKTLAKGSLEGHRDVIRSTYAQIMVQTFGTVYRLSTSSSSTETLLYPATKYANPDILKELLRMPVFEQPSRGWKWFCHKYEIDSLGIGSVELYGDAWSSIYGHGSCVRRELAWGYPFWDKEKLEAWGLIMSSSLKKKQKKNKETGEENTMGKVEVKCDETNAEQQE